jgi:hypothetical protein
LGAAPQGIAWETFHTLGSIPTYGDGGEPAFAESKGKDDACCVPVIPVPFTR